MNPLQQPLLLNVNIFNTAQRRELSDDALERLIRNEIKIINQHKTKIKVCLFAMLIALIATTIAAATQLNQDSTSIMATVDYGLIALSALFASAGFIYLNKESHERRLEVLNNETRRRSSGIEMAQFY